jgi:hypothetical protein
VGIDGGNLLRQMDVPDLQQNPGVSEPVEVGRFILFFKGNAEHVQVGDIFLFQISDEVMIVAGQAQAKEQVLPGEEKGLGKDVVPA